MLLEYLFHANLQLFNANNVLQSLIMPLLRTSSKYHLQRITENGFGMRCFLLQWNAIYRGDEYQNPVTQPFVFATWKSVLENI